MYKKTKKAPVISLIIALTMLFILFISCTLPSANSGKSDKNIDQIVGTKESVSSTDSSIWVGPFNIYQLDVTNSWSKIDYLQSDYVMVFCMQSSGRTSDPATLRGKILNGGDRYVRVEEEISGDDEATHESEKIVAIKAKKGLLKANDRIIGEAGSIDISRNTSWWKTITLDSNVGYTHPVVIASLVSYNDGSPCHVRVEKVTNTSFRIKLQEWPYLNGPHPTETVNYIVINGINDDTNGHYYILGNDRNTASDACWGLTAWSGNEIKMKTGEFYNYSFGNLTDYIEQKPFVFADMQTCNSDTPVIRISDIKYDGDKYSNSFTFTYQEQEKDNSKHNEQSEAIGYIAIGPIDDEGYSNVVDDYGYLQVKNNKLSDEAGKKQVILTGMSAFWMNWDEGKKYANDDVIRWLIKDFKIEVYRAAMGVKPEDPDGIAKYQDANHEPQAKIIDDTGYVDDPNGNLQTLETVMDSCIERGIYVIVDWHVHDALASYNKEAALEFFDYISKHWGKYNPNIIYEIWNEPSWPAHVRYPKKTSTQIAAITDSTLLSNEADPVDWATIKSYCIEIINTIRANDPKNIIICPTPCWDQWPNFSNDPSTTLDPIKDTELKKKDYAKNIMYAFHFYAGSHMIKNNNNHDANPTPGNYIYYSTGYTWATAEAESKKYLTTGGSTTPGPTALPKDPYSPNLWKLIWSWNFDPWCRLDKRLDNNPIPIFVTEWGTSLYDGGQANTSKTAYTKAADDWINYMSDYGLSWCNWSVCDKNEGASILKSGASTHGNWEDTDLTDSGKYIREKLRKAHDTPDKNL